VANEAGVSVAYLSDLERAVLTNPTLDKLRKIAGALGASIDDLLDAAPGAAAAGSIPAALQDFVASASFHSEVDAQAAAWRRDPRDLREEWLRLLGAIELGGRRPAAPSDYLFIFESIRRAISA
jgi:transcriptional regulator with XRE-family HTH domain